MSDAQRRRACILEAADRLLRHYGPQKTTVADVAREAGVGVGTVYLEFTSKDAIVEEISRARHLGVLAAMRAAAAGEQGAAQQLTAALDARLGSFLAITTEGAHACDLVHCVSSAVKSAQASFHEEELTLLTGILRRGAEAAELAVDDPEQTARALLRAYATFTLPWLGGKDPDESRRAQAALHRLVLHGLLRRAGPSAKTKR